MFIRKSFFILLSCCALLSVNAQTKKGNSTGSNSNAGKTEDVENVINTSNSIQKLNSFEASNSVSNKIVYYEISESSLKNAESVTTLILRNLDLTELPAELSKFTNLQELDLSGNNLKDVSSAISSLTNLKDLNLNANELTSIPSSICGLKNLKVLNLSANKISGGSVSCLNSLEHLYLNNNQLTALPSGLTELTSLKTLYLHSNSLTELSTKFIKFPHLNVLQVQLNKITEQPTAYENCGIFSFNFYPQSINDNYIYKYLALGSAGSASSAKSDEDSQESTQTSLINTAGFEKVEDKDYNIRSVDIGNGYRKIKVGDHPYKRYSKLRLGINALGYLALYSEIHWLISKQHRDNIRLSYIYYNQEEIEKIAKKRSTFARLKRVEAINTSSIKLYRKYLRSHGLTASN